MAENTVTSQTVTPNLCKLVTDGPPDRPVDSERLYPQSYADAIRTIYPTIERLPEDVLQHDATLNVERFKHEEWTARFFNAAFRPPNIKLTADALQIMQSKFWQTLQESMEHHSSSLLQPYNHDMVDVRFSLLFHIALRMHEGGAAIYPAHGLFGQHFRYQRDLKFRERLERMEEYLRRHNWLVLDIIEDNFTQVFVASPDEWVTARLESWRREAMSKVAKAENTASANGARGHAITANEETESAHPIKTADCHGQGALACGGKTQTPHSKTPVTEQETQTGPLRPHDIVRRDQHSGKDRHQQAMQDMETIRRFSQISCRYRPERLRPDDQDSFYDTSDEEC